MMTLNKQIWIFFALLSLFKLWLASQLELGFDESHYFLYGRCLALSYLDHPPLVGWVHAFFSLLPLPIEIGVRLPAIVVSAGITWLSMKWLQGLQFSEHTIFHAVVMSQLILGFFALQFMLLPDSLLLLLVMALLVAFQQRRSAIQVGFLLGLLGLSKYTAVFLVPGVAWVWKKMRSEKGWGQLFTMATVAFAVTMPVWIWNYRNDGLSFYYQVNRVLAEGGMDTFGQSMLVLVVFYGFSPLLVLPGGIGWLWQQQRHLLSVLLPGILFFLFSAWRGFVLPHWWAALFLPFLLVGFANLQPGRFKKIVVGLIGAQATLLFAIGVAISSGVLWHWQPHWLRDVYGWRQVSEQMKAYEERHGPQNWAVMSWVFAGRVLAYSPAQIQPRFFVLDARFDQYDLWNPKPFPKQGTDRLLLTWSYDRANLPNLEQCQSWTPVEQWQLPKTRDFVRVFRCD